MSSLQNCIKCSHSRLYVRGLSRLKYILFYTHLHSTRFTLAIAELLWAISLLWPGDTFNRPTYTLMSLLMSETCWAYIFLVTGLFQILILMYANYHSKVAIIFAAWNSLLWWYVVVSMYMSVYPPPAAISGELALALGASWVFTRSGWQINGRI